MTKRHSLDYIKKVLSDKQLLWLNEKDGYKTQYDSLCLKCLKHDCGYEWTTSFASIKQTKYGCLKCGGCLKFSSEEIIKILDDKNILWLNKKDGYRNRQAKMKLKCRNCNYTWLTNFKNANRIRKCIKCSGFAKYSIKEIVEILNNKNIIWVDKKGYKDNHSILKFKCKKCNCLWNTAFCHININKTGCSNCSSCKTEKLCRKYLEGKFKVQFSKIYPEWLNGLQLDGYNEKLNIAFEYNGRQHYEHIKYFHTKKEFTAQQQRDILKRKILKEKGVKLIDIPFNYNHRKENELYKFIDTELDKLNLPTFSRR